MKKNKKNKDLEKLKKALEGVDKKAFDGHTEFCKLTPRQRLEWLDELIYFKNLVKKK
jgi:hypothetical protein